GDLEDIEIRGGYGVEIVEGGVVPARVRGPGDVHRGAVVGEGEAVFFHGVENDLIGSGEGGDIEAGFEAEPLAHGRGGGVAGGGSPVGGWWCETGAGILERKTNRVIDGTGGDFVVANQSGKDGEACGVGAGPGVGALLVGEEIPDGAGIGIPGS